MRPKRLACALAILAACSVCLVAQSQSARDSGYLLPPKVIVDILDAAPIPTATVSPSRQMIALTERKSMPTIAELAQPMLRLAGARISPKTNGPHRTPGTTGITLRTIADGSEKKVTAPPNARPSAMRTRRCCAGSRRTEYKIAATTMPARKTKKVPASLNKPNATPLFVT